MYPFHDGKFEDFEPVFERLIEVDLPTRFYLPVGVNDLHDVQGRYQRRHLPAYTTAFLRPSKSLTARADALAPTNPEEAAEPYLRRGVPTPHSALPVHHVVSPRSTVL